MTGSETFTAEQMGVEVTYRKVKALLDEARSGGFFCIRGYENKQGEVADHYLQFGISYGKIKGRDIETLRAILNRQPFSVEVKYGVWLDEQGEAHTHKAKGRTHSRVTLSLDMTDERLSAAVAEVLESLVHPAPAKASYGKEAKGLYENESDGALHVRDCLTVSKTVRVEGEYPESAKSQDVAIRDAVRSTLLTGRYRQFIFQGKPLEDGRARYESITLSGQAILSGTGDTTLFALPEVVNANAAGELVPA